MRKFIYILVIILTVCGSSDAIAQIVAPADYSVSPLPRTGLQKGFGTASDVAAITLPVATLAGVLIAQDWEGLKEAALTAAVATAATYVLKFSVRELRPDHSNFHSFPSMHSTTAFATAAFLQRRYGWKFGGPAYVIATFTAVGRVVGKKHHWWDCVVGAAIGAGSAYIFTRPWAQRHELAIMPVATPTDIGVTAQISF